MMTNKSYCFNMADTINDINVVIDNGEGYRLGAGVRFLVTEWVGPGRGNRTGFDNLWGKLMGVYYK